MGVGGVNPTSNIDSRLSKVFTYPNDFILERGKGVQIIEVGLCLLPQNSTHDLTRALRAHTLYPAHALHLHYRATWTYAVDNLYLHLLGQS